MNQTSKIVKRKNWYLKYFLWIFKIFSAAGLSIFLAILGQAFIGYGIFSFIFIFLTVFFAFLSLVRKLQFFGVLLVIILIVLLVFFSRMYVIAAYYK